MEQLDIFGGSVEIKSKKKSVILSASRMTDMPKFYPEELIKQVEERINKGIDIHTLVLWSKHPQALLSEKLYEYLVHLKKHGVQLYYQCTITGMGNRVIGKNSDGSDFILEPLVPKAKEAIKDLERVIELLENPLRIKLRIDPIVKLRNTKTENKFSNINLVEPIILETSKLGIKNYTFSFLEKNIHNKVDRRFNTYEWEIVEVNVEEKRKVYEWMKSKASKYGCKIEACCVPGLNESRCIDGYLLSDMYNFNKNIDFREPRKRELCACTHSIDIGGWPPKKCYSGCKYCYANAYVE